MEDILMAVMNLSPSSWRFPLDITDVTKNMRQTRRGKAAGRRKGACPVGKTRSDSFPNPIHRHHNFILFCLQDNFYPRAILEVF